MPPEPASEDAITRLMREIAKDRARLSFAMQNVDTDKSVEPSATGRLYEVFRAAGQVQ